MKTIHNPSQADKFFNMLEKAEIEMLGFLRMTMNCKMFSHTCKFVRDNLTDIDKGYEYVYVEERKDGGRSLSFSSKRITNALTYAEFQTVLNSLGIDIGSVRVGNDYIFNRREK